MRAAIGFSSAIALSAIVIACSSSTDPGTGSGTSPTNPTPTGSSGSSGSSGDSTSGSSGQSTSGSSGQSTSGSSGASGTSGTSGAADAGADGPATNCVPMGYAGNDKKVGAYCDQNVSCPFQTSPFLICTYGHDDTGTHLFCTAPCSKDSECGTGAYCVHDTAGSGCVPTQCGGMPGM